MRPLLVRCATHRACVWASAVLVKPHLVRIHRIRAFHTSREPLISVADRIKQFLPAGATEDTAGPEAEPFYVSDAEQGPGIHAFTTELRAIDVLVTKGQLDTACKQLLEQLPLHVVLSALIDRVVPLVSRSPVAELGIYELAYHLHLLDQSALASQLLQSVEPHNYRGSVYLQEFELVRAVSSAAGPLTAREMDLAVQHELETFFPAIMRSNHSRWLKARLLAALDDKDFTKIFRSWGETLVPDIGPPGIALLNKTSQSSTVHDELRTCVFNMENRDYVDTLVRATSTNEDLSRAWKKLKKRIRYSESTDPVLQAALPSLLKAAIKMGRSYDVANICKFGAAQLERHPKLLAKALLAVAFAQKRTESDSNLVASPRDELHTFLAHRVLTPVLNDAATYDRVVGLTASYLREKGVPSRVLWQLLMSLPEDRQLGYKSSFALAPLVSARPYVEQLRYMALPSVSITGITELMRLHISRIMNHRRLNRVSDSEQQADEDINLLISGMLLASEKARELTPDVRERELARMVSEVFEQWKGDDDPAAVVSTTASWHGTMAPSIVHQMIRLLVAHRGHTLALQILRLVKGRQSVATLEILLLRISTDMPAKSIATILWLMRTAKISIPPHILNKMLVRLCNSPLLTESQLMNQFQKIRRTAIMHLGSSVNAEAASALVDALIRSSVARRGGSKHRLRWALDVAKKAGVSDKDFVRWTHILEVMQEKKQGFWTE